MIIISWMIVANLCIFFFFANGAIRIAFRGGPKTQPNRNTGYPAGGQREKTQEKAEPSSKKIHQ